MNQTSSRPLKLSANTISLASLVLSLTTVLASACGDKHPRATQLNQPACSNGQREELQALNLSGCPRDFSSATLRAHCVVKIEGISKFWPLATCFDALPQKVISGYWVYGFEASYFVADLSELDPKHHYLGSWLFHSEDARRALGEIPDDGELRAFRVKFLGVNPEMIGMPLFSWDPSFYAKNVLQVEQIPEAFKVPSDPPPNKSLERSRDR